MMGMEGLLVEQGPRKIIMDEDAKGLLPLLNLNQGGQTMMLKATYLNFSLGIGIFIVSNHVFLVRVHRR